MLQGKIYLATIFKNGNGTKAMLHITLLRGEAIVCLPVRAVPKKLKYKCRLVPCPFLSKTTKNGKELNLDWRNEHRFESFHK